MSKELKNVELNQFHQIQQQELVKADDFDHPPRILLLYGSLRERSFSRLVAEESKPAPRLTCNRHYKHDGSIRASSLHNE